jgi:hypothetical protein
MKLRVDGHEIVGMIVVMHLIAMVDVKPFWDWSERLLKDMPTTFNPPTVHL